jgi:serine/threonine protein kinase
VQKNHNYDAELYLTQGRQRMLSEFIVMTACASSPYIVDAFAAGNIAAAGGAAALPAILMEYAELGDVQQSLIDGQVKQQIRFPGLSPKQQQQQACGLSSAVSQRIVRAAALGLRDLHDMAGHIHCDMKTNNLLVSISKCEVSVGFQAACGLCPF